MPQATPGAGPGVAFESAAPEAVAALEVTDASFGADTETGEPAVGAPRPGRAASGDEDAIGAGEVLIDTGRIEAAVERDLARAQGEAVQLGGGLGQQVGLVGRADLGCRGHDQSAGAAAGVLADLG